MIEPTFDKAAVKRERRRIKRIKQINRVTTIFGWGYSFRQGEWKFGRMRKANNVVHTYEDSIRRWNLTREITTPLDENTARRLLEGDFELRDEAKKSTRDKKRRYIPADIGLEGMFRLLNERGIRYAVLRWFDTLPNLDPGEDIDILFADEDVAIVDELFLLHKRDGAIKCDIYSASGLKGSNFHGLPYYERRLAEQILDNTVFHAEVFKVPS